MEAAPNMTLMLLAALMILWAFLQKAALDATGHAPRSRRSYRSQRRKARQLGVRPEDLDYNAPVTPLEPVRIPKAIEWACGIAAAVIFAALIFG